MEYYNAINVIESQQRLVQLKIADFPNMKDDARRNMHKDIHKQAYPSKGGKILTSEELEVWFKSKGI